MKTFILFITSIVLVLQASAQIVPDTTFTDCSSNSQSVYGVLGTGKVLVVATVGTTDPISQSQASGIGTFAMANTTSITVWGSMTNLQGGPVSCSAISAWVTQYNWNSIFSFSDDNRFGSVKECQNTL